MAPAGVGYQEMDCLCGGVWCAELSSTTQVLISVAV
jgi:hypothetical protein